MPEESLDRAHRIAANAPMVRRIALHMALRLPSWIEVDDLTSVGMIGLIEAVDRYEEARAESFTAYAKIRIRGAILDDLRRHDWASRGLREQATRLRRGREELTARLRRAPTAAELAEHLGVDLDELAAAEQGSAAPTEISLDDVAGDRLPLADRLAAPIDDPAQAMERRHDVDRLYDVMNRLPPRERSLAELYYLHDLSLKEIGALMGVTESRVCQIHTRLKARLRVLLDEHVAA